MGTIRRWYSDSVGLFVEEEEEAFVSAITGTEEGDNKQLYNLL